MPGYGTKEGCRYAQLRRTGTAVYMPIYGTHGRHPICSDMGAAIDMLSYSGGSGTDMTG